MNGSEFMKTIKLLFLMLIILLTSCRNEDKKPYDFYCRAFNNNSNYLNVKNHINESKSFIYNLYKQSRSYFIYVKDQTCEINYHIDDLYNNEDFVKQKTINESIEKYIKYDSKNNILNIKTVFSVYYTNTDVTLKTTEEEQYQFKDETSLIKINKSDKLYSFMQVNIEDYASDIFDYYVNLYYIDEININNDEDLCEYYLDTNLGTLQYSIYTYDDNKSETKHVLNQNIMEKNYIIDKDIVKKSIRLKEIDGNKIVFQCHNQHTKFIQVESQKISKIKYSSFDFINE